MPFCFGSSLAKRVDCCASLGVLQAITSMNNSKQDVKLAKIGNCLLKLWLILSGFLLVLKNNTQVRTFAFCLNQDFQDYRIFCCFYFSLRFAAEHSDFSASLEMTLARRGARRARKSLREG